MGQHQHHHPADGPDTGPDTAVTQDSSSPLWRTRIAVSALVICVIIAGTWWLFRWLSINLPASADDTGEVEDRIELQETAADTAVADADGSDSQDNGADIGADQPHVVVHVVGEVANPGVYELTTEDRVIDALDAAGGPTEDAVLEGLNLAAPVQDGQQILVPDQHSQDQAPAGSGGASTTGGGGEPVAAGEAVNVNTADAAGLESLPGVGPATAEKIINHRDHHGPFGSLADLEAVSGIGPATLERLDGLVSF